MNIRSLLEEAFYSAEASRATAAIAEARDAVSAAGRVDGYSIEVVVPDEVDEQWLRERVLHPLIYFCQSTGVPAPACPGVFLTFFHGDRLSCVLGAEVIAWAARELGEGEQALIDEYGTGEREAGAPRTV
jgi:hypothetical protein